MTTKSITFLSYLLINFQIHSHKTSSTSGAARVHIYDNSVNVLLRYGDERVELEERFKNIPIHPYAARNENSRKFVDPGLKLFQFTTSFTDHWAKIRRRYPKMNNLTHTMYRFFVETLVSNFSNGIIKCFVISIIICFCRISKRILRICKEQFLTI